MVIVTPGQVLSLCCLVQYLPHKRVKYAYNYDHFNWYHYTYRNKYDYEQQKQQQQLFSVRFRARLQISQLMCNILMTHNLQLS